MEKSKKLKKKRKINKSDYGENFVPPDGGYGWIICIASGLSNIALYPVFQQFGIIYRDKLLGMGLNHSQITTIINVNTAIASLSGFLNGPMFRRFSYRQVGIAGSLISTVAIFLTILSNSFGSFLFCFGILLGFGFGIISSVNALIFNVYFKKNRSKASSWISTITGIGPIIFPYIISYLMDIYGVYGAILILTGISAHSIAFAMTFQPVIWHGKRDNQLKILNADRNNSKAIKNNMVCEKCNCITETILNAVNNSISADYEENDINSLDFKIITEYPEIEIINTTKNISKSKDNLTTQYTKQTSQLHRNSVSKNSEEELALILHDISDDKKKSKIKSKVVKCQCNISHILKNNESKNVSAIELKTKISSRRNFLNIFELGLLKNLTFLNIIVGLTLAFFAELNFSFLRPFILKDFELEQYQILFLISMPAIPDLVFRFLIQFIVKKVKLTNRTFYLLGIFGTTISRAVIALKPSYIVMCAAFFCLGIFKAFRTVFYGIVIPDYVPLKSLPAAVGINRLFDGIFPIILGPLVGLVRDHSNYQITIHFINLLSMITVISWTVEILFSHRKNKRKPVVNLEEI